MAAAKKIYNATRNKTCCMVLIRATQKRDNCEKLHNIAKSDMQKIIALLVRY